MAASYHKKRISLLTFAFWQWCWGKTLDRDAKLTWCELREVQLRWSVIYNRWRVFFWGGQQFLLLTSLSTSSLPLHGSHLYRKHEHILEQLNHKNMYQQSLLEERWMTTGGWSVIRSQAMTANNDMNSALRMNISCQTPDGYKAYTSVSQILTGC